MELLLIRHAKPEIIEHDPNGADPQLTDLGHRQAAALADYLAPERVDAIWSSPQRRARETAAPLATSKSLDIRIDERLAEWDYGDTSYSPPAGDGMKQTPEEAQVLIDRMLQPAFMDRIMAGLDEVVASHKSQTVAVVCHGGVIGTALTLMLDVPAMISKLSPNHTSVTRVTAAGNGFRSLRSFNESQWLQFLSEG